MAKKKFKKKVEKVIEENVSSSEVPAVPESPKEEVKEPETPSEAASEATKVKTPCPDCTKTINEGGKSQFTGKGGVKPGLLDEKTICSACEGKGY